MREDQIAIAEMVIVEITTISGDVANDEEQKSLLDAARGVDAVMRAGKRCMICVSGYDDDQRSLDKIPEARRGILGFWDAFQPFYEAMGVRQSFLGLVSSNIPILVIGCMASDGKIGGVELRSDGRSSIEIDPTGSVLNLSASIVSHYESLGHPFVPEEHAKRLWSNAVCKSGVKWHPKTKTNMGTRH